MKVTEVSWQGYSLPFRDEFRTSRESAGVRHGLLLRLRTGGSVTGLGEASPVGPSSSAEVRAVAAALEKAAPGWAGRDVDDLLASLAGFGLPAPLRFGLETALLDVKGRSTGHPLAVVLGGRPAAVPVNALVTVTSPAKAAAAAADAVKNGGEAAPRPQHGLGRGRRH
jgi:L-alanine-DL-glutamate epimerase-like enolase superfamily enzyme